MIISESSVKFGFVIKGMGAHTGRTIMFREIAALFAACPGEKSIDEYRNAIIEENALLKPTASAREESFRRLKQLYTLDAQIVVFRSLRMLWEQDTDRQPLLALLAATARDPLLRATVQTVIDLPQNDTVTALDFAQVINATFPDQLTKNTLASVGRNLASSWTQSGHFSGETQKMRKLVQASPVVTAFALFLGYLCDFRGDALFDSPWTRLLDTPKHILSDQAQQASQLGWLEFRRSGAITEITFRHFLKDQS